MPATPANDTAPIRTAAELQARRVALSMGSAVTASADFNGPAMPWPLTDEDRAYRAALSCLVGLETGSTVSELEFICSNPAGVHPDWTARLETARSRSAEWHREMSVAKASLYLNSGIAA